ncbi:hypothetical protein [Actinomadura gamaensis]|uniref:Uncharacterized protein n=1 Tax=Actinomadura gamaensis TaxID=1763541 RepID=A0ABV9U7T1_9ACTN
MMRTPREQRQLDQLAELLSAAGWTTVARYELSPRLLRVTHPALDRTGLTVHVEPLVARNCEVAWFSDGVGRYLGTCYQLPQVMAAIHDLLGPLVADAGWPVPADALPNRRNWQQLMKKGLR